MIDSLREHPNEYRADRAMRIVDTFTDRNYQHDDPADGMRSDISDVIADLMHLCDRYGIDRERVLDDGLRAYFGDMEDGPAVRPIVGEKR